MVKYRLDENALQDENAIYLMISQFGTFHKKRNISQLIKRYLELLVC